jgi:16S rRNA processing protein RimM
MGQIAGWTSSIEERPAGVARGGRATGSDGREEAAVTGILIGRVAGAHGLRGQLRVRCFGDEPAALLEITRLSLDPRNEEEESCSYEVSAIAPGRSGELRVALAGVCRREQAEALQGRNVRVDPDQIPALPSDQYYSFQLIGCQVESSDGAPIGTVREIWRTGAPDVLVVEDAAGNEQLIPAAEALLREVDIEGRRVVIEIPPGLLDAE